MRRSILHVNTLHAHAHTCLYRSEAGERAIHDEQVHQAFTCGVGGRLARA